MQDKAQAWSKTRGLKRAIEAGNEAAIEQARAALLKHGTISGAAEALGIGPRSMSRAIDATALLDQAYREGDAARSARLAEVGECRATLRHEKAAALETEIAQIRADLLKNAREMWTSQLSAALEKLDKAIDRYRRTKPRKTK